MAKHNIGDIVCYTNKNERLVVYGEVVAIWRDSWSGSRQVMIEPLDESFNHSRLFHTTVSTTQDYQFNPNKFGNHSVNLRRSLRRCIWAPMVSKNLVAAYPSKDYDPTQNGDRDEDI